MYGRWGWRGILAYLIGFAAMVPFFDVGTLYEGAAAKALGNADISFFIGLPIAAGLYYLFTRSVDVAAETRVAQAEAAELEEAAAQHELPCPTDRARPAPGHASGRKCVCRCSGRAASVGCRPRSHRNGRTVMPARALARRFPVLGLRDFRLLLADRLLAPGAFAFSLVAVAFAVLDTTGSTADLSYVLVAQIAPSLVFTLIGGVFADRMPPQRVIIAGNLMIALGEGTFGLLVLTGQARLWQMIVLECVTGTGMAVFYPASQALLPRLVPGELLTQASALSRLAMNAGQMAGAAVAGLVVAAIGPGWALAICGVGMLGTVPVLLSLSAADGDRSAGRGLWRELRDGWSEFRSRTWLWTIVAQYCDHPDGLVRRVHGARARGRAQPPGRPRGVGRDHGRGIGRPDRRRADVAALLAAPAHAVRGRSWA